MKMVQTKMKIAIASSFSCFILYVFTEMGGYSAARTFLYPIRTANLLYQRLPILLPLC